MLHTIKINNVIFQETSDQGGELTIETAKTMKGTIKDINLALRKIGLNYQVVLINREWQLYENSTRKYVALYPNNVNVYMISKYAYTDNGKIANYFLGL